MSIELGLFFFLPSNFLKDFKKKTLNTKSLIQDLFFLYLLKSLISKKYIDSRGQQTFKVHNLV